MYTTSLLSFESLWSFPLWIQTASLHDQGRTKEASIGEGRAQTGLETNGSQLATQKSILANGFCSSLAILAIENMWALEAQRKPIHKMKLSQSVQNVKHWL